MYLCPAALLRKGEELICIRDGFFPQEGDRHTAPGLILQMASHSCDPGSCAPPPWVSKSKLYSILS